MGGGFECIAILGSNHIAILKKEKGVVVYIIY